MKGSRKGQTKWKEAGRRGGTRGVGHFPLFFAAGGDE
jgi:hypothetical protein